MEDTKTRSSKIVATEVVESFIAGGVCSIGLMYSFCGARGWKLAAAVVAVVSVVSVLLFYAQMFFNARSASLRFQEAQPFIPTTVVSNV